MVKKNEESKRVRSRGRERKKNRKKNTNCRSYVNLICLYIVLIVLFWGQSHSSVALNPNLFRLAVAVCENFVI